MAACQDVYHPLKGGIGFLDLPTGPEAFQISYIGDSTMSVTEARRFALIRAAELATLQGKSYFQIQSENILLSTGTHVWPPSDVPYVETFRDRNGRTRAFIHHSYDPGYVESFTIPDVEMQVRLTTDSAAPSISAAYLLRQAMADKIKLSPGVAGRLSSLPPPPETVTLPSEPAPVPKPGS